MLGKEPAEVVGDYRRLVDVRIQTARPGAGLQHVPDGDMLRGQAFAARAVLEALADAVDRLDDRPKGIAGVRIVLPGQQRGPTGHRTQYQALGVRAGQRRKTVDARHAIRSGGSRGGLGCEPEYGLGTGNPRLSIGAVNR